LAELDDPKGELLIALNKGDLVDDDALDARREAAAEVAGDRAANVFAVSALEGDGIGRLRDAVAGALPSDEATFELPNTGETQSFVAWAHEHGRVTVEYEGNRVRVQFAGRPSVVERARSRADEVRGG
jgi:GTP-binding protein HflX